MKAIKEIIYIFIIIILSILLIFTHLDNLTASDWINLTMGLITSTSTIIIGYATIKISSFPFSKKIEIYHWFWCKQNNIDYTAEIQVTNIGFCPIAIKHIELYDNKHLVEERYFSQCYIIKSNDSRILKLNFKLTNDFEHTKKKKIIITDINGNKFIYKFNNYAVG